MQHDSTAPARPGAASASGREAGAPARLQVAANDYNSEVRDLLLTVWRYKVLIVVCTLLAGLAGAAAASSTPKTYSATVQLSLDTTNHALFGNGNASPDTTAIPTAVALLSSNELRGETVERLKGKLDWSIASVVAVPDSTIIAITAESSSGATAAAAANAYARTYVERRLAAVTTGAERRSQVITTQIRKLQPQLSALAKQLSAEQDAVNAVAAKGRTANTSSLDALRRQYDGLSTTIQSFQQDVAQYDATAALHDGGAAVIVPAVDPGAPAPRHLLRNAVLAGAIGLVLGLFSAFLLNAVGVGSPLRRRRARRAATRSEVGLPSGAVEA